MLVQLLLKWNGFPLPLPEDELAEIFISIAAGRASEEDLLTWLQTLLV